MVMFSCKNRANPQLFGDKTSRTYGKTTLPGIRLAKNLLDHHTNNILQEGFRFIYL